MRASPEGSRLNVLVAMSGGVDSSVAAALLLEAGHDVTGCTLKLWGGTSDRGCCSVSDVDDARRVAQQLGIDHFVFNFGESFQAAVIDPYVSAHASGRTPNPCVECNRSIKFDRLLHRAYALGFDALATGHHARIDREQSDCEQSDCEQIDGEQIDGEEGVWRLRRGVDAAKDQSYVLHMLGQEQLARTLLPVGHLTKSAVRQRATSLDLRTAGKPDSQDVCFIGSTEGRSSFLDGRLALRPGRVIDGDGVEVGRVPAVQLVTVGQRRGLGLAGGTDPQYAVSVDVPTATVTVGRRAELLSSRVQVGSMSWTARPAAGPVTVQCSAHGTPRSAIFDPESSVVHFERRLPRVAPGQSVVLYSGDRVLGGGPALP